VKNDVRSACPRSKKLPRKKVNDPASARKMTMKMYASGVAK
jgi:hypothetical protein